jgi:hypothetical protein
MAEVSFSDRLVWLEASIDLTRGHLREVIRQKTQDLRAEKKKYTSHVSALKRKAKERGLDDLEAHSFVNAVLQSEELEKKIEQAVKSERRVLEVLNRLDKARREICTEHLQSLGLKVEPLHLEPPARLTADGVRAMVYRLLQQAVGRDGGSGA